MPSAGPEFEESWSVVQLRLDSRPTIPLYPTPTPHQGVTLKDSFWEKLSTTENCHQVNLSGCLFVTDEFVNHLVRIIEPKSHLQVGKVLLLHQLCYNSRSWWLWWTTHPNHNRVN